MKMCLNWRVVGGLAALAVAVAVVAPGVVVAALPLLVLAVCPLSMLLMMRGMGGMRMGGERRAPGDHQLPDASDRDAQVTELRAELAVLEAQRKILSEEQAGGSDLRDSRPAQG